jgi:serine/threonine-protein kinase
MVMELLSGKTSERLMEAAGRSLKRAFPLPAGSCGSGPRPLKGVVHRDVSAANIMIGPDGTAKITDFGLAIDQQEVRLTQSGTPLGSCSSMWPSRFAAVDRSTVKPDVCFVRRGVARTVLRTEGLPPRRRVSLMEARRSLAAPSLALD